VIVGSEKYESVGKYQSALILISALVRATHWHWRLNSSAAHLLLLGGSSPSRSPTVTTGMLASSAARRCGRSEAAGASLWPDDGRLGDRGTAAALPPSAPSTTGCDPTAAAASTSAGWRRARAAAPAPAASCRTCCAPDTRHG
jgi:hypothetical protein